MAALEINGLLIIFSTPNILTIVSKKKKIDNALKNEKLHQKINTLDDLFIFKCADSQKCLLWNITVREIKGVSAPFFGNENGKSLEKKFTNRN